MTEEGQDNPGRDATGLDEDAERLYRLLLAKADSSVAQLAAEGGLAAAHVRAHLTELVEAGFATMVADSRYRAVAPDAVLGGRLASELESVRSGYEALRELMEIHRTGASRDGGDDRGRWEQVTGAVAIQSRLDQMRESAEECVRTFVKPPIVLPVPDSEEHREVQRRGVRCKLLFDRAVLDADPHAAYLRRTLEWGEEVRFAKSLPLKMIIVDDRIAMIEDTGPGRPRALLTAQKSIVRLALALFEQSWLAGIPAPVRGEDAGTGEGTSEGAEGINDDDALLLALLIAGLTDQSIATKLGIGLRTVQRRVRDLMDLAEVDTRIQLGWHAAKHGWVS